jgi:hypothetical protein
MGHNRVTELAHAYPPSLRKQTRDSLREDFDFIVFGRFGLRTLQRRGPSAGQCGDVSHLAQSNGSPVSLHRTVQRQVWRS